MDLMHLDAIKSLEATLIRAILYTGFKSCLVYIHIVEVDHTWEKSGTFGQLYILIVNKNISLYFTQTFVYI